MNKNNPIFTGVEGSGQAFTIHPTKSVTDVYLELSEKFFALKAENQKLKDDAEHQRWIADELSHHKELLNSYMDKSNDLEEDRNVWQRVAGRLEEAVKQLNTELGHDHTQITALKHKLEDCAEGRHIAERRLENLQGSWDDLNTEYQDYLRRTDKKLETILETVENIIEAD